MVWTFKGNRKVHFPARMMKWNREENKFQFLIFFIFWGAACLIDKSRSAAVTTVGDKYCNYALEKAQKNVVVVVDPHFLD